MKIVTVLGARPQFVKAAMVSRELETCHDISEIIVHTGQHFDHDMSDVFFREMGIPDPDYYLGVASLPHGAMTGRMLEETEKVLVREKPDLVLVYGDTNSTLAGALAASKLHIPIVHVEAGLRSFNTRMPEEINRIVADRLSTLLCCPTATAVANARADGLARGGCVIVNTGDVMKDAAMHFAALAEERSTIRRRLGITEQDYGLCTLHRAENVDDPETLAKIASALNELARDHRIVLPLHPRTRQRLTASSLRLEVQTTEPVSYFDMLELVRHCRVVVTDSGGLQKEAFFFNKPCVTIRTETEWEELVEAGVNLLAGSSRKRIIAGVRGFWSRAPEFDADLYGDGRAARRIVAAMKRLPVM